MYKLHAKSFFILEISAKENDVWEITLKKRKETLIINDK